MNLTRLAKTKLFSSQINSIIIHLITLIFGFSDDTVKGEEISVDKKIIKRLSLIKVSMHSAPNASL